MVYSSENTKPADFLGIITRGLHWMYPLSFFFLKCHTGLDWHDLVQLYSYEFCVNTNSAWSILTVKSCLLIYHLINVPLFQFKMHNFSNAERTSHWDVLQPLWKHLETLIWTKPNLNSYIPHLRSLVIKYLGDKYASELLLTTYRNMT